ncbi:MAG: energy transducer TonB [Candidatus Zixiibacteriota bacterium]
MKYQDPKADLPGQLPIVNRKATIITLLLLLFALYAFVGGSAKKVKAVSIQEVIEIDDVPITKQKIKEPEKPKPKRAEVVEAEEEEEADTVEIAETELDVDSFIPPATEEDDEVYEFFAVEEQAEISNRVDPKYPELAKKSGMEGLVLVEVIISKEGDVTSAKVVGVRPKGVEGFFEEAAVNAARKFKFTPAKQRGKPVAVKKKIPFEFSLD